MSGAADGPIEDAVQPPPPGRLATDRALLATPSRQSPVAVVFIAWRFIKNLGMVNIGIAGAFLLTGRLSGVLLGVAMMAASVGLVFMVLAWWRFEFSVEGDELLVAKGVVAEERLTTPLDRVQSVAINQKFLHRPFGLVSASVDTAGSSAAEFEIDAVERPKAEALQRLVAAQRRSGASRSPDRSDGGPGPAGPPPPFGSGPPGGGGAEADTDVEIEVLRRAPVDLVRIGVSRWPWAGLVALAPLVALAEDLQSVVPFDLPDEALVQDTLPSEVGAELLAFAVVGILLIVLVISLLGAFLQVGRELVTNWDLRLVRTSNDLRRTAGLLSKTSKASTLSRIQALQTDQTPIQRLLGIRNLILPTVGEGDIGVPGVSEAEVGTIRQIVFGRGREPVLDRKISPLSILLSVRKRVLIVLPLIVLLWRPIGWPALLILLAIPLEWLVARRRWRLRRWSLSPTRIAESYQLVNRHTAEIDLIKAQTVSVSQSFFERRRGLATVRIATAAGHLTVPLIDHAEATAVRDRALYAVESDRRSFM